MSDKGGQVAVILILVVAAALIFYAVSINLGRVSQGKTVTTIAADTAASTLGSYMASMGQSVFKTSLGGKRKVCGWTGILITIIAVIIAIIIIIVTWGSGTPFAMAIVSLVLALGALAMQVMVIQPGLTSAWSDIIWHTMEMRDAFVEQGVQAALGSAVTDPVQVPDFTDSDGDRLWGLDAGNQPLDEASRFGLYYMEQRINTIPPPASTDVQDFLDALKGFLLDDGDNWGLYDDSGPVCAPFNNSSECDPSCVPSTEPAIRQNCEDNSPYGTDYPWVYDAYRGNPLNAFISFQEQLGRDDEHARYRKNPLDPNGMQNFVPASGFRLEDTTGFYRPPYYPANDNRTGSFPFFYKIADWKVDLSAPLDLMNKPEQCYWCDPREPTVGACLAGQPAEIPQLVLPAGNPPGGALYDTSFCVDGTNLAAGVVVVPDRVVLPGPPGPGGKIEADDDQCAQSAAGNPVIGIWKRGGDRFCSPGGDQFPYWGMCPKFGSCPADDLGCACGDPGAAPAALWPDDLLDELVYGLNFFIEWAQAAVVADAAQLGKNFRSWYLDAAQWIEGGAAAPMQGSSATSSPTCDDDLSSSFSCCYLCDQKDGALVGWYEGIQEIRNRLEAWRDTSFVSPSCSDLDAAWCVPPAGCPWIPAGEAATFDNNDTNGDGTPDGPNGIRGDFEDVVNCLNWNANVDGGNANRFNMCKTGCENGLVDDFAQANTWCSALPRSLVPGFDTTAYIPTNISELVACQNTLTAGCGVDPALTCVAYGTTYVCSDAAAVIPAAIAGRIAAGSCAATGAGGFKTLVDQSIPEATNQVAKFRKRHTFLSRRLAEMDSLLSALRAAENQFYQFLTCDDNDGDTEPDGAACRLIKARIDFDNKKTGLPYHAIYGWQGEPAKGQPPGSGKWHVVRADARIPERCDKACNVSQTPTGDPRWPWVKTYTKNWGTKRCYELAGTDGVVKVRVGRYDETSALSTLLFPNGVEIWKPSFLRGDRPLTADPLDIEAKCTSNMLPDPDGSLASLGSYYYGAFMLNERLDNAPDPECVANCQIDPDPPGCTALCPMTTNKDCWDLANELLSTGVNSEACVQYYYHGQEGDRSGMDFKFVPCRNF